MILSPDIHGVDFHGEPIDDEVLKREFGEKVAGIIRLPFSAYPIPSFFEMQAGGDDEEVFTVVNRMQPGQGVPYIVGEPYAVVKINSRGKGGGPPELDLNNGFSAVCEAVSGIQAMREFELEEWRHVPRVGNDRRLYVQEKYDDPTIDYGTEIIMATFRKVEAALLS